MGGDRRRVGLVRFVGSPLNFFCDNVFFVPPKRVLLASEWWVSLFSLLFFLWSVVLILHSLLAFSDSFRIFAGRQFFYSLFSLFENQVTVWFLCFFW